jgi:RNA polymerase sigma factor (sigma-70 family)
MLCHILRKLIENLESVYVDKHYDLVVECKNGSKKAHYELYQLYSKAMLNTAFRIVDNLDEAQDVLQEAFLDAFARIKDFRQETTFGLWIKQIVVHRSINLLRKRKMELISIDDEQLDNLADDDSYDDEEITYKVAQVKEAIKLLPEGYRVVLSLYLLEGYDHEEIGHILHINENTSRTQFLRAKRKLIEILKQKGIVA